MAKQNKTLAIGIMSGTSLDAIDAVLVELLPNLKAANVLAFHSRKFHPDLRKLILKNNYPGTSSIVEICDLNIYLSHVAAKLVKGLLKKAKVLPSKVTCIGYHGQTVQHLPEPHAVLDQKIRSTLQIGDGPTLAALTGIPVVNNFRTKDMANGGGGAPLVPLVHKILFAKDKRKIAVHNLGGISNLTYLSPKKIMGFDTGPANMLIDGLMGHLFNQSFDRGGQMAAKGKIHQPLATKFLFNEYFLKAPPKSTGREAFGGPFIRQWLNSGRGLKPEDLVATATYFTALTIIDAYKRFILPHGLDEITFCGGGAHNPVLIKTIQAALAIPCTTTAKYGIDPQAIECVVFALLGTLGFKRRINQIAELTGAVKASSLGQVSWPD